jgi:folate-binding protein YgfZ
VADVLGGSTDQLGMLPVHGVARLTVDADTAVVRRTEDVGVPALELLADSELLTRVEEQLRGAGVVDMTPETADVLRIEAGIPVWGRELDQETIPLEAGIEDRAISFTKGCYVGQEIIIRVLHRGHGRVARKLVGLLLLEPGAAVPDSAAVVLSDDKDIGTVTSSAWSPSLGRPIALGYVKRDFAPAGTRVTVGGVDAEVAALPFVAA